jgi:hypothetical protein
VNKFTKELETLEEEESKRRNQVGRIDSGLIALNVRHTKDAKTRLETLQKVRAYIT